MKAAGVSRIGVPPQFQGLFFLDAKQCLRLDPNFLP
jgi:hypothetical protein